jgi:hypothetical protein
MQIGLEWKKMQKMDDLMQKEVLETLAARTFTLVNAIIAS